ncbi:hypothetical protein ABIB62_001760 [Mucilaginibacter sp. UYP25]|uniref:hypothetical protein n=1 Tax=unclassified Mucilaginibacter TaxID=2617802 RepID=UPI00339600DF
MPEILLVTDWNEKSYFSTGGTREKSLLESPEGYNYYFKTSLNKPGKDYRFEFWSEIIASEIGQLLGLNMLKYDVAIKDNIIGCISQSMINSEKERLIEGVNYLVGYNNMYDPKSKEHQPLYSYQYIKEALKYFKLDYFVPDIDEIIVFDALIGNGDRHQENWGVIVGHADVQTKIGNSDIFQTGSYVKNKLRDVYNLFSKRGYRYSEKDSLSTLIGIATEKIRFSPIYDSGSSLAREHDDNKISIMLKDNIQFEAYINRGKSEIHWLGNKLKHFELVRELIKSSDKGKETLNLFKERFNEEKIRSIIYNVDKDVPPEFKDFKLSEHRKEFLTKLITLRYKRLVSIQF